MKFVCALCIILVLSIAGCGGKKEIKPSEDSLRTKEAMELITSIQTAYQGKQGEVLASHIHPVIAKPIIEGLSFDSVELYFTPWVVRIKEESTILHADWQGTWVYGDREIKRRGMANFVFIESPMKLVHINGDNPFYTPSVDYEEEEAAIPEEPLEQAPPQPPVDEMKTGDAPEPAEEQDITEQPVPGPEPMKKDDGPSDLEPLKRSKLLYREHDIVPLDQPKVIRGEEQKRYVVQVGAWKNRDYAQTALELVKGYYPEAVIVTESGFHKIRIKKMMTKQEGMLVIEGLEEKFNLKPVLIGLDPESPGDPTVTAADADSRTYFVQIGVWRNYAFAEAAFSDLQKRYPEAVITKAGTLHKVGIPVKGSREQATALADELKERLKLYAIIIEQ